MNKERESNFELLRIVSMFFIVFYHTILHGHVLINCTNQTLKIILDIIMSILIVHVNSFVLVSGYFQSKSTFKQSKLWSIINANWFYKVLILVIFSIFSLESFTKNDIFVNIFPLNLEEYWFINPYLIVYCLSPFLNKLINSISKRDHQKLIIVLVVILSIFPYITGNRIYTNSGYTLYNFIILYIVGAYLNRYPLRESYLFKNLSDNLYQILTLIIFFTCVIINYSFYKTALSLTETNSIFGILGKNITDMSYAYSNPLIMLQSVAYFAFFSTLKLKSKFINRVSQLTLGVYFIHDNVYMRLNIYKWLKIDIPEITSCKFLIYTLLIAIGIYIACLIIEWIRQFIFKGIYKLKISKFFREKYYSYIKNIYIKKSNVC